MLQRRREPLEGHVLTDTEREAHDASLRARVSAEIRRLVDRPNVLGTIIGIIMIGGVVALIVSALLTLLGVEGVDLDAGPGDPGDRPGP